jgi:hypothetical protein
MSQLILWNLHTKRGLSQQNRPVQTQKDEVSGDTQLHIAPPAAPCLFLLPLCKTQYQRSADKGSAAVSVFNK